MNATIHRGAKEIGGTCIELTARNGKVLWVDLGAPLDNNNPDTSYTNRRADALLISHPHQDHYGLMDRVAHNTPIHIGEVGLAFINAVRMFIGKDALQGAYITFEPWQPFTIEDTFTITPYLTDHSTPESFAFLIEADGKRIFYSGDFRGTGRKKALFDRMISRPLERIDLLFLEGTMIQRLGHAYPTEASVEQGIHDVIKNQQNASFVISSAQNIDRLVSLVRACRRTAKKVIIDPYTAWLLDILKKRTENIPTMEWEEIRVYEHPSQMNRIADKSFEPFRNRVHANRAGNGVFEAPWDFVHFSRDANRSLIEKIKQHGKVNIIYSQWEGYLNEMHKQHFTDNINTLRQTPWITFHSIHTSGHASVPDLVRFAQALAPERLIPIHTAHPMAFKDELERFGSMNVELWNDGENHLI